MTDLATARVTYVAYTQAGALGGPYRKDALLVAARLQAESGHLTERGPSCPALSW